MMTRLFHLRSKSLTSLSATLLGVFIAVTFAPASAFAQDGTDLKNVLERLEKVEKELQELKQTGKVSLKPEDHRLVTVLSEPNLGVYYAGQPTEVRWFAVRVTLINLTGKEVTVSPDDYTLSADGNQLKLTELPSQIRSTSFQSGNQSYRLSALQTQTLTLHHGANGQTWLVFAGLAKGTTPRSLELEIAHSDGKVATIDVVDYFGQQLGLTVERVGPRASLAVITVKGALNTVSLLKLVKELDGLVEDKVARAVIRWEKGTPQPDANIINWMRQVAVQSGMQEVVNYLYPTIPSAISEFHLVDPKPGSTGTSYRTVIRNGVRTSQPYNPYAKNVHKSVEIAIAAALKSAYEILPRDELVEEIQNGHRLTRAAALSVGGGRLDSEHLPVILKMAGDDDVEIQRAALIALRHFGESQAIETLVHYARKNVKPLGETAVESLAGSRYSAAHGELLKLLEEDTLTSRKEIVNILGKYARPIWADTLYKFVTDKNSGVRVEALAALVTVGDDRLLATLKDALKGDDRKISEAALSHLIARDDRQSEKLALEWTLTHIEKSPPTPVMYQLLTKTKDQRAIAPLLKHLESRKGDQSQLISTLAQIGDESVGDTLASLFDKMGNNEKRAVLNALYQLRTPAFRKIAKASLKSSDYNLISTTCQLLQQNASPESVEILIDALKASSNTNQHSYICNALGAIATNEARDALREASKKGDDNQKNIARQALKNLYTRSPGMNYVRQGQGWFQQKNAAKALTFYELAVQVDPELPHARRARANQLLRETKLDDKQLKTVQEDYKKLVELEPENSETWTGLGLVSIRLGDVAGGIKQGEDIRGKSKGANIYHYNMACIYGRAVEATQKKADLTDAEKAKITEWQKQAMTDLKESVKLGFADLKWLQEDPDLTSLHDLPDYKEFVKEKTAGQPKPAPAQPDDPAAPQAAALRAVAPQAAAPVRRVLPARIQQIQIQIKKK
jgi:HEAT repeat protein